MAKITFRRSNSANISTPSADHASLFIDVADGYIKVRNPDGTITNYAPSGSVAEANAYTDSKIADLVGAAPELLDTLQELADAINDDPNFATSITALISQESADRIAAISAEQTARENADVALQGAIDAEALARETADNDLDSRVSVLEADSVTQSYVDTAIASEQAAREAAISALQSELDITQTESGLSAGGFYTPPATANYIESADFIAAGLVPNIVNSTRLLDTALKSEADARESAVTALQTDLSAEATARENADNALDARLDVLEADPVTKTYVDGQLSSVNSSLSALESFKNAQLVHVSKSGNDSTGTGGQHKPYASISAALASITDASPTKRYLVKVEAGNYTETTLSLKANVFIAGEQKEAVRITATTINLASDFSGSGDHRSGFSQVILLGTCDFNWATVTSAAGKLYFNEVSFSNNISLYGHNNAIAQAQFDSCIFFGSFTVSGINVGTHTNNYHHGNINLNQHPNGGMATILAAAGGQCSGTVTLTTTVNDFNRRCSLFAKNFYMEYVTVNGASSYADMNEGSLPRSRDRISAPNGGNVVYITTNAPHVSNTYNVGEPNYQYLFNFAYVHGSTETDLYLVSMGSDYAAASTGRSIFIESDTYGLNSNVNGGDINLATAVTSGTGVRGKIKLDGREVDLVNTKIVNLADPTANQDAATKKYVDDTAATTLSSANAYADQKVADLVDSAPAVLDTLKELADALGGDENFSATIAGQIGALDSRLDSLEADPVTKAYVDSADAALQTSIDTKQNSLGTGTSTQYLRGDLVWHNEKYVTTLSWSGTGPYTMSIPAATHDQGTDPIVSIKELIDSEWIDCVTVEVRTNASGDITISSAETFDGKVVVK